MEPCHFDELPEEMLWKILALLDAEDLLKNVNIVCKRWHRAIQSQSFWRAVKVDANQLGSNFIKLLEKFPALDAVNMNVDDAESVPMLHALGEKEVKELHITIGVEPFTPLFSKFHNSANVPVRVTRKLRVRYLYSYHLTQDSFLSNLLKGNCNFLTSVDIRLSMWGALTNDISSSLANCHNVTTLRIPAPSLIVAFSLPSLSQLTLDVDYSIHCEKLRADLKGHYGLRELKSLSLNAEYCPDDNSGFLRLLATFCDKVQHVCIKGDCWEPDSVLALVQNCTSVNIVSKAFTKQFLDSLMSSSVTNINGTAYLTPGEIASVEPLLESFQSKNVNLEYYYKESNKRVYDSDESDY